MTGDIAATASSRCDEVVNTIELEWTSVGELDGQVLGWSARGGRIKVKCPRSLHRPRPRTGFLRVTYEG